MAGLGRAGVGWDIRESVVRSTLTGALFVLGGLSVLPTLLPVQVHLICRSYKCLCVSTLFNSSLASTEKPRDTVSEAAARCHVNLESTSTD